MNNQFKLPTKSIQDILKIYDTIFGALAICYLTLAFTSFYMGDLAGKGLVIITLFPVWNLKLSYFSARSKSPIRVELFRFMVNILIICPLILLWVNGPLAPFWYCYLIIATASVNIFFQLTGGYKLSIIMVSATILSYLITSYFFVGDPNWFNLIAKSAIMLAFSWLLL